MILKIEYSWILLLVLIIALVWCLAFIIWNRFIKEPPCDSIENLEYIATFYNQKIEEISFSKGKSNVVKRKELSKLIDKKNYYLQNPCLFLDQFINKKK